MSDKSVVADLDGLRGLSTTLRNGADDLGTAAVPITGAPDAGRSSANVGAALSAVVRSVGQLVAQSQLTAQRINANSGAYGHVDNQVATGLGDLEGELLEPN